MTPTTRTIALATAVSGTLDLLSAFVFGGIAGRTPAQAMASVASGPFGRWPLAHPVAGPLAGLLVHYAIMSVMVAVFVLLAGGRPALRARPVASGAAYGVLLYLVMYWVVLPLRFPAKFPDASAYGIANALFSHVVCVGVPMALIAARTLRPSRA